MSAAWKVGFLVGALQRKREAVAKVQRGRVEEQLNRVLLVQTPLEVGVLRAPLDVAQAQLKREPTLEY